MRLLMTNASTQRLVADADKFLKFVRARVADRDTALDVLQDAFVKALGKIDGLRDEDRVVAWFYRILRTTITDLHRHRAVEGRVLRREASVDDLEVAAEPDEGVARDCLRLLLGNLKPEQADIIEQVDLGGESPADYAQRHNITDAAFRVRRHRARQALRETIDAVCRCLIDRDADCVCAHC